MFACGALNSGVNLSALMGVGPSRRAEGAAWRPATPCQPRWPSGLRRLVSSPRTTPGASQRRGAFSAKTLSKPKPCQVSVLKSSGIPRACQPVPPNPRSTPLLTASIGRRSVVALLRYHLPGGSAMKCFTSQHLVMSGHNLT